MPNAVDNEATTRMTLSKLPTNKQTGKGRAEHVES